MDKITLEELSAYLPYDLKMIFERTGGRVITLMGINNQGKYGVTITGGEGAMFLNTCGFKPLLRPLSQLTQEIEHKGERFVFSDRYLANTEIKMLLDKSLCTFNNPLNDIDYNSVKLLLKYHFDVFGLIHRGLAVEIKEGV